MYVCFVCGKHLCVGFKNRLMIIGVVQSLVSYYNWEFKKRYEKKIVSEEQKKNSIPHKKNEKKNRLKKNRLIKKDDKEMGKD